jgi:hypothetical protein
MCRPWAGAGLHGSLRGREAAEGLGCHRPSSLARRPVPSRPTTGRGCALLPPTPRPGPARHALPCGSDPQNAVRTHSSTTSPVGSRGGGAAEGKSSGAGNARATPLARRAISRSGPAAPRSRDPAARSEAPSNATGDPTTRGSGASGIARWHGAGWPDGKRFPPLRNWFSVGCRGEAPQDAASAWNFSS